MAEVEFLGAMVGRAGIRPVTSKIQAVRELEIDIHTQITCMHAYTKCTTRWYPAPQQEVSTHPCARVMKTIKREHRNVVGVRL